jgi:MFS family permease
MFWGSWAACLPAIQRSTGASDAQLGLALLCVALAALPAMLVAGRLADSYGPARLVPIFLVFFGLVATLPGLARSVGMLVLFLVSIGVATGLLDISINSHAARLEALHGIRIMDGLHAAFSAGVVVGGVGAGVLRRVGAHPSWILAGVACCGALAALVNRGPYLAPAPRKPRARLARPLVIVGLVLALAFLVENGLEAWSALFLERTLHTSPAISGLGPGLFAGAMVTGRVVAQKVLRPSVAGRMLFAGLAAAGGLAIAASAQHPAVALIGFVIAGGGLALSAPTLFGLAGRLGGEGGRGAAMSTVAILGYLGFVAGPALIGAVSGATSLRGGFLFLCAVAVVLATCAPILRRVVDETGG